MSSLKYGQFRRAFVFVFIITLLSVDLLGLLSPVTKAQSTQSLPSNSQSKGDGMIVPLSLEQRVKNSVIIVEAKALERASFWDDRHANIYTSNRMQVYKVFKGDVSGSQLEIITQGGVVGDRMLVVSHELKLSEGQMGIFLLEPSRISNPAIQNARLAFMAYGSEQGFIEYDLPNNTASEPFRVYNGIENNLYNELTRLTGTGFREIADNVELRNSRSRAKTFEAQATPVITGLSPNPITAGTDVVPTITGSNFGATQGSGFVEFRNADNGGATFTQPLVTDYVSWSDTQIQVMVPTLPNPAGTGGDQWHGRNRNQHTAINRQFRHHQY